MPGSPTVPISASGRPFQLPRQTVLGSNRLEEVLWLDITKSMHGEPHAQMPVLVVANGAGEIYFKSEGYRIGVGEEVAKTIAKMKN